MTNRERLFAVLEGRRPDRVPIWLLFPYHRTSYYVDVRTNPCYRAIFELSRRCAVMLDRRNLSCPLWTSEVEVRHAALEENGWSVKRMTVAHHGRTLVAETRRRADECIVKKLIGNEDELDVFLTLPILTGRAEIEAALAPQLPAYAAERAEFPREYGAMMLDLGEPIGALYQHANLTEYPIWSLTRDAEIRAWLERVQQRCRVIYRFCLERDLAEVYFLVGSELASPPMVSRATFQQWIVPHAQELIAMIHAHGCKVIQHYHGQIKEILPDFLTMAPDALHTIEAPPTGNCTFSEAFSIVGDAIALIGNIQYDCFRSCTPDEMRAAVKAVLDECRGRRLILSPTAGPYEETLSERQIENYLAFIQAGWECGAGGPSLL